MGSSKLKILFSAIIIFYIVSPIVWKHTPWIQRSLVFMNYFNTQFNVNLSHPEQLGLKCTRTLRLINNLKLENKPDLNENKVIELGVWHILPESSLPSCITTHDNNRTTIEDSLAFSDSKPIVIYIHGNGGNRAGNHRGQLYKRLAYEHDYHVITFDYRGYGDSTVIGPSTDGLSLDARFIYEWLLIQKNVSKDRIIIWGHSLGTGVAIRMLADLNENKRPSRLILEAPFDSVSNAVAYHPFSKPFQFIPYFEYFFVEPVEKNLDLNFDSKSRIGDIKSMPIMILHAEDDGIIPFKLGLNLYKVAVKKLGEKNVKFVQISGSHGVGHKNIYNHDETMLKVRKFIDNYNSEEL